MSVQRIRTMIGDSDEVLSDEQIEEILADRTLKDDGGNVVSVNLPAAAADCAEALAAHYAKEFNFAEDQQRFDRSQKHSHYMALARELRNRSGGIGVPFGPEA